MPPGAEVVVEGSRLTFLYHPRYADAHPGEDGQEPCEKCAVARRHDTGEHVLLWLCEGKHWIVSRADPEWSRHRRELQQQAAHESPALVAA